MHARARFDLLLLVGLAAVLFADRTGFSLSTDLFWAVVDTILSLDPAVYLVLGGVLGVLFVGYIAVYLPRKQSENVPR